MVRQPDPQLLEFLSAYDRSIAALALALREVVVAEAPDAVESIYDAYNAVAVSFSFSGRLKDAFCHIATYETHVNLGFNRGASLPDPHRVLVGTGKSIRHIRIAKPGDLDLPFLRTYIRAAIGQVEQTRKPTGEGRAVVKGNYTRKRRPSPKR